MAEVHPSLRTIFSEAISIESPDEIQRYLDDVCGENTALREEVLELIRWHQGGGKFLGGASSDAPELTAEPTFIGVQIGPYRILDRIGEGGMGEVYVAEQATPMRRQVALKIIKAGMDSKEVLGRFEVERQALALMDHPNIAHVYEGGTTREGRPYFVMELVHGVPIIEFFDQYQLTIKKRLRLFIDVCQAIQHAHQKGIIHRDIKPSNVLVTLCDDKPLVKVIDFGIAKAVDQELIQSATHTRSAQMVGTPAYMSPEQAELRRLGIDTRTDIYSLGVLLYELLTGTTPTYDKQLENASYDEVRRILRDVEPPRPSARVSTLQADFSTTIAEQRQTSSGRLFQQLRGELDWIVTKCLEKDRARRYETASALAEDVQRFLGNEPILALPPSTIYRLQKFVARNRPLAASIAAVFLAMAVGTTLATIGFVRASQGGAAAQRALAEATEAKITAQKALAKSAQRERELEKAIRTVGELLDSDFGAEARGAKTTQRESVERLATDRNWQDGGRVEIEIRRIIASALRKYGEHARARGFLAKALKLAKQEYGASSETVADILSSISNEIHDYQGSDDPVMFYNDAQQALDIYRRKELRSNHRAYALTAQAVYEMLYGHQINEAVVLQRESLEIVQEQAQESDAEPVLFAMWDLSSMLMRGDEKQRDEAVAVIRNAVSRCRARHGDEHSLTANLVAAEGRCLGRQGNLKQALSCYHQAWQSYEDTELEDERRFHRIGIRFAETLLADYQFLEAERILKQLEDSKQRSSIQYADCWFVRGAGQLQQEDFHSAETSLRRAIKLSQDTDDGVIEPLARFHLARCLQQQPTRVDDARQEFRVLLPFLQSHRKWDSVLNIVRYLQAWSLLHCGQDYAQLALDEANTGLAEAQAPADTGFQADLLLAKGVAQYRLARTNDERKVAVSTLRDALSAITFPEYLPFATDLPRSRGLIETTLASYLAELDDMAAAEQVFETGIAARVDRLGANHLEVGLAQLRYGEFLLAHGLLSEAERHLLIAKKTLEENPEVAKSTTTRANNSLATLYVADTIPPPKASLPLQAPQ